MANQAQNKKPVETKATAPAVKNPRSDTIPRTRPRGDKKVLEHTYSAGRLDRGKPDADFEVVSTSMRTGEIIRTRHQTHEKAVKAAEGRAAHHRNIVVYDQRPASVLVHSSDRLEPLAIAA